MSGSAHAKVVKAWLARLAVVTAGEAPLADQQRKIDLIADDLAHDFPDSAAFTNDSCRVVAGAVDEFPAYGKLKAFLSAWWEQNRPAPQGPAAEPDDLDATDLPTADKILVRKWVGAARLEGNRRAIGDWVAQPWPNGVVQAVVANGHCPALAVDLSLIRRHASAGYRWLLRQHRGAYDIARKMGWTDIEAKREPPTPEEVAAVSERVGMLTNAAGQILPSGEPAPPNPAHQTAAQRYAAQFQAKRGRKPGQLSEEALAATWQRQGLTRPQAPDPPKPPSEEAVE